MMETQEIHGDDVPDQKIEGDAKLQEVLHTPLYGLLTKYSTCKPSVLQGRIKLQQSRTLGELCTRLKKIKPKFCEFEHDHQGSVITQTNCILRETNAACGHLGLTGDKRYMREGGQFTTANNKNAVATMEETMAVLEAMGIECDYERKQTVNIALRLRAWDSTAVGVKPENIQGRKELHEAQEQYGPMLMKVLPPLMEKITRMCRALADGKYPIRSDYATIKNRITMSDNDRNYYTALRFEADNKKRQAS